MPDANDPLENLTRDLPADLAGQIRDAFESAVARATGKPRYQPDTEDRLANIEDRNRDPLEGVLDTSAPERSLGERPRRARGSRRRPAGAESNPTMAFLRRLRETTQRNEQLQREGMHSYYEPESFNRAELDAAEEGGYSPAMSFAPPSLESMSSRPRPPAYTEGPMSSTEGFYEATRRNPNPMVRGLGMRYRPR